MLPVLAQAARRGADHAGVRERRRHAVVLEAARRVHPLVLQEQPPGLQADVRGDRVGPLAERLPLADGHDLVVRGEREQFAEPPDAGEVERVGAVRPLRLEVRERLRRRQAVPVVGDVEQPAALRAAERGVRQVDGRPRSAGLMQRWNARSVMRAVVADARVPFTPNRRPLNGTPSGADQVNVWYTSFESDPRHRPANPCPRTCSR